MLNIKDNRNNIVEEVLDIFKAEREGHYKKYCNLKFKFVNHIICTIYNQLFPVLTPRMGSILLA